MHFLPSANTAQPLQWILSALADSTTRKICAHGCSGHVGVPMGLAEPLQSGELLVPITYRMHSDRYKVDVVVTL
jgi:hypothetical protein